MIRGRRREGGLINFLPLKKVGLIREGDFIEDLRYVVFVKRILYFSMGIPLGSVVIGAFSHVIERTRIIALKVLC